VDLGSSTATQFSSQSPRLYEYAASSASTNPTSTSDFSLSTSFINLTAQDINFFDQVIDLLPPGADNFADLKKAYNQSRSGGGQTINEERDAFLWDTLLNLVKVRGKDWAHRWDAVRMANGLDPRVHSGSEREKEDYDDEEEEDTSESDTVREQRQGRSSTLTTSSVPPKTTRADIEALRRRMELLTAEAGSLVGVIKKRAEDGNHFGPHLTSNLTPKEERMSKPNGRQLPARQLRFAEQQGAKRSQKATIVESASDEETSRPRSVPKRTLQYDNVAEGKTTGAMRQFEEVVARSRNEREAQKRTLEEQQESAEEARLAPLLRKADFSSSLYLKQKCFVWWRTLFTQRWQREAEAKRARDGLVAGKALAAWQSRQVERKVKMRGAEKVDVVRCKIRAWRTWRRSLFEARSAKKEEKRSQLKGAYVLTRKKAEQKLVKETFLSWKVALMERRTAHFRTQHLVRGAFCLWRLYLWRSKTLKDKEDEVKDKVNERILSEAQERWIQANRVQRMTRLADSLHGHHLLQLALVKWKDARDEKASMRRKEALADRWRARRIKRSTSRVWQSRLERLRELEEGADCIRLRNIDQLKATTLQIWRLREREQLFTRVRVSKVTALAFDKWIQHHRQLTSRLINLENHFANKTALTRLSKTFGIWRETTRQVVTSQRLASERDRRKIKTDVFTRWSETLAKKQAEMHRAKTVDAFLLQKKMLSTWSKKLVEIKAQKLHSRRNHKLMSVTLAFWKARSAERRQDMLAVGLMRNKIETRIRKECLAKWTAAVIERKSLLMEAGEKRDAMVLERLWLQWIDACLRHEDMLNLSQSFIDIKREDLLRRSFSKWSNFARAEHNRKERAEHFLRQKKKVVVEKVFEKWYDGYVEASLRPMEYEALLQRQRIAEKVVFSRWKSRTKSLPAIRLDHVRSKSHAFYQWLERLPLVKVENKAAKWDRRLMQEKGFRHWYAATKAKRALRAATRFGGPSAVRLRATAHHRQRGNGNPFGGGGSSSPTPPIVRSRSFDASKVVRTKPQMTSSILQTPTPRKAVSTTAIREEQESLRESDLIAVSSERRITLELDHHNETTPGRSNLPPALQRWMQNLEQAGKGTTTLEDVEASSEPPSSVLDHRWIQRRGQINRTPSPPASQVQSEATTRVKNSPRKSNKLPRREADTATENTMDLLRSRRRQRRRMIFDD